MTVNSHCGRNCGAARSSTPLARGNHGACGPSNIRDNGSKAVEASRLDYKNMSAALPEPASTPALSSAPPQIAPVVSDRLMAELHEILEATVLLMDGDLGSIQLFEPVHRTLHIVAQLGFPPEFVEALGTVSIEAETAGARSLRQSKRIVIRDVNVEPGYEPFRAIAALAGFRAVQSGCFDRRGSIVADIGRSASPVVPSGQRSA